MGRLASKRKSSSPLAAHIGAKLLAARQAVGVTMRTVATGTGISNAFICQIENGQSVPSGETLWKLAKYFEVNVNYFFEEYKE
jgi:transcriptional regulator with XRE-family HTH domain